MKFIVITSPDFLPDEARRIEELFGCGLDVLHLRKPGASVEDCVRLLDTLSAECHRHIVVHDHFRLCRDYGLQGVHLNHRNPEAPGFVMAARERYTVSASCHSVAEVARQQATADYVFMSPIFDSISKQGYAAAYPCNELERAAADGIINDKVMALGGVAPAGIGALREWHFGGAVFLGDVWGRAGQADFIVHASALAEAIHRTAT